MFLVRFFVRLAFSRSSISLSLLSSLLQSVFVAVLTNFDGSIVLLVGIFFGEGLSIGETLSRVFFLLYGWAIGVEYHCITDRVGCRCFN